MPLTQTMTFKAALQRGNRVQIPRLFRWQYKIESDQVLKVNVRSLDTLNEEKFLGRMTGDGRLTIPRLTLRLLEGDEEESLAGRILEVTVGPLEEPGMQSS